LKLKVDYIFSIFFLLFYLSYQRATTMADPHTSGDDKNRLFSHAPGQETDEAEGSAMEDIDVGAEADIEMNEPESEELETEEDTESEYAIIDKDPDLGFGQEGDDQSAGRDRDNASNNQTSADVLELTESQLFGGGADSNGSGENPDEDVSVENGQSSGENGFAMVGDDVLADSADSQTESAIEDGGMLDTSVTGDNSGNLGDDIRQSVDAVLNAGSLRNRKCKDHSPSTIIMIILASEF
jgi:hypothetical protein